MQRLPVLVAGELILGFAVLLATGVLTSSPPANGPEFAQSAPAAAVALSRQADDLLVVLEAKPNRPGDNVLLVKVANTRRPAPAPVMRVIVHFTYLGQQLGQVTADAQPITPDTYQLAGQQLSLAGPWRVDVAVRRKGLEDSTASFQWSVAPTLSTRPVVFSNQPIGPAVSWAGLAALAALGLAAVAVTTAALMRRHVAPAGAAFAPRFGLGALVPRQGRSGARDPGGIATTAKIHLRKNAMYVILNRAERNYQPLGDLLIGRTRAEMLQDLELPVGERVIGGRTCVPRRRAGKLIENTRIHGRGQRLFAPGRRSHKRQKLRHRDVLQHIPLGALTDRREQPLILVKHRQKYDGKLRLSWRESRAWHRAPFHRAG